jgi:hypothetical protein
MKTEGAMQAKPEIEFSEPLTAVDLDRVMGDFRPIGAVFDEFVDYTLAGTFWFLLGMVGGALAVLLTIWASAAILFSLGATV